MNQLMNTVPKGACTRLVTLKYFLLHYIYDLFLEEKICKSVQFVWDCKLKYIHWGIFINDVQKSMWACLLKSLHNIFVIEL